MVVKRHFIITPILLCGVIIGGLVDLNLGGCAGSTKFRLPPDSSQPADGLTFLDTRFIIADGVHDIHPTDGPSITPKSDGPSIPPKKDGPPTTCTPGLCRTCVAGKAVMPQDDPACGVIDCDGLDTFVVKGAPSPTSTNYRVKRDYADITSKRCKSLGQCKKPNSADCTQVKEVTVNACGDCELATKTGCANYADGTLCLGKYTWKYGPCESRCFSGTCAWRLHSINSGVITCDKFCPQAAAACKGTKKVNTGQLVGCDHNIPDERLYCFCGCNNSCTAQCR